LWSLHFRKRMRGGLRVVLLLIWRGGIGCSSAHVSRSDHGTRARTYPISFLSSLRASTSIVRTSHLLIPSAITNTNASPPTKTPNPQPPSFAQYPHEPKKRKQPDESPSKSKKKKAGQKPKQTNLSMFFVQPSTSSTASSSGPTQTKTSKDEDQEQPEAHYKLEKTSKDEERDLLSKAYPTPSFPIPALKQNTNQTQAWSHLLSPLQPCASSTKNQQ